ncbi:MAG: TRAP transporter large permease [Kiritimatiellia bacterium]
MTLVQIGALGCILMLLLLFGSMPVAFAMGVTGICGYAVAVSGRAAMSVLTADVFEIFSSYSLTVIPLFVFMGQVSFHAGISGRLFAAANSWLAGLRGGLAMATVGACAAFGAICGSGPATAATMSAVALPEMKKYNYDLSLASGTVAAGGGLGMLIPPSVVFIVYGVLTEQSIGKLFIAGILPGLLTAVTFCLVIAGQCALKPALAPRTRKVTWSVKFRALAGVLETLLLFMFVMGGIFAGWFTPTEGAAVGAAGSVAIAAAGGNCSLKMLMKAARETVRTSCMVMVIVAGATIFGHFLAITNIPTAFAAWLAGLPVAPWVIVIMTLLFYLLAGCFVDALALILLTIPIFYPVIIQQLGYDPVWFGVMIVMVTQMGVITPPVGVNAYVVSGIDRSVSLQMVFRGAMPFLFALVGITALLMFFPEIATWLPQMVK